MDVLGRYEQYCNLKGLRHTKQREHVLEVFWRTERHASVEELYDLVKQKYKGIGVATVSRTMKLLAEAGICREVEFGDGFRRYEHLHGHDHHDHLICLDCKEFVEIYSPEIEKLQEKLVKKYRYTQRYHRLEIFGYCEKCAEKHKRG